MYNWQPCHRVGKLHGLPATPPPCSHVSEACVFIVTDDEHDICLRHMKIYIKKYCKNPLINENSFLVAVAKHSVHTYYLSSLLATQLVTWSPTHVNTYSLQALRCRVVKAIKPYQTRCVSLGASRGVIINQLGRCRNEEGNNDHPHQHPSGRQRI